MKSSLPSSVIGLLECLGFTFVKFDARTSKEHWLSQEALPHIELKIDYNEQCFTSDIVRAIHSAGAFDQRETTRRAFNRLVETFRNGNHVAPATDLLAIDEDVPLASLTRPSI